MEFQLMDTSSLTEDEILSVLDSNCRVAVMRREEVQRLKNARETYCVSSSNMNTIPAMEEVKNDLDENTFETEYQYYWQEFMNIPVSSLEEEIDDVLPEKEDYHYTDVILRLMAEVNRARKEIYEIFITEKDSIQKDELDEFKKELSELNLRMSSLRNCLLTEEKIVEENPILNQLVFVPTNAGNIRVLDDLKSIPKDYYAGFLELFQSIMDGTFKNIKRFSSNSSLQGMLEVKGFKIRVVFSRLVDNKYAVITAFMKKANNTAGYRNSLQNKVSEFHAIENQLIKNTEDEEFMKMQEEIQLELFRALGDCTSMGDSEVKIHD